jgi:hypothetical protein
MLNFRSSVLSIVAVMCCLVAMAQPQNDICSSATDLQPYLDESAQLAGPFSNVGATGNDLNIADVTGCWLDDLTGNADGSSPQIDATVWFRLEGYDGVLMLYVQPCDSNLNFISEDTQMALYTGECDSLEIVDCNEDINSASTNYWSGITTTIQAGTTYYVAIDGFNYSGFGSPELPLTTGEFCISFQEPVVSVLEYTKKVVSAFPNPTNGSVSIQAESEIREIAVSDVTGKTVMQVFTQQNVRTYNLRMPAEEGVYLVRVKTDHGIFTERIIRN